MRLFEPNTKPCDSHADDSYWAMNGTKPCVFKRKVGQVTSFAFKLYTLAIMHISSVLSTLTQLLFSREGITSVIIYN